MQILRCLNDLSHKIKLIDSNKSEIADINFKICLAKRTKILYGRFENFKYENLVRLLQILGKSYRRVKKTWKIHFDWKLSVKRHS
jgi:hypothetical protein